jgi:hypothetical protein
MKGALISLGIGIILLLVFCSRISIYIGGSTFDVHFHDTYFVFSKWSVIILVTFFLGTFFWIGGLIGTRFRNKWVWLMALLFLGVTAYYVVFFYRAFTTF